MFPSLFGFQMPPRPKSQEEEEEEEEEDPNCRTLISGAPLIKKPYKPDEDEPPTRTWSWRSSTSTPPDASLSNGKDSKSAGKVGGVQHCHIASFKNSLNYVPLSELVRAPLCKCTMYSAVKAASHHMLLFTATNTIIAQVLLIRRERERE